MLRFGRESILQQQRFTDSIYYLKDEAIRYLEGQLNIFKINDHNGFVQLWKTGGIGHIAFVWFYHNIPQVCEFQIKFVSDSSKKVKLDIVGKKFNMHGSKNHLIVPLGIYNAARPLYTDNKFWRSHKSLEEAMEKLLETQSEATPNSVGPPYAIIRITRNGEKWYKKGMCK